jgi:hypothetical protein
MANALANARNAQFSTGPRTAAGKAVVRHNALRHGVLSRDTLLPDEDPGKLRALADQLTRALEPEGELEMLLVGRVIAAAWRLRRLMRLESGVIAWHHAQACLDQAESEKQRHEYDFSREYRAKDERPQKGHEDAYRQARAGVDRATQASETGLATLGLAVEKAAGGADSLTKLSRYEAMIERSFYRALHELQRLQAARSGQPVALPAAVDVTLSSAE